MLTQLQDELNTFLDRYSICGFRIFRDWILKKAGLPEESQKYCHFYGYDKNYDSNLYLRLRGLDEENSNKLLTFLNQDKIEDNKIQLDEELIFNQLLPDFINSMTNESPFSQAELLSYQICSKDKLERALVEKISSVAEQLQLQYHAHSVVGEGHPFVSQLKLLQECCRQYFWPGKSQLAAHNIGNYFSSLKSWVQQNPEGLTNQTTELFNRPLSKLQILH